MRKKRNMSGMFFSQQKDEIKYKDYFRFYFNMEDKRKGSVKPYSCQICGFDAFYSYYGVISCEACKIFFRRNAQNRKVNRYIFKIKKFIYSFRIY